MDEAFRRVGAAELSRYARDPSSAVDLASVGLLAFSADDLPDDPFVRSWMSRAPCMLALLGGRREDMVVVADILLPEDAADRVALGLPAEIEAAAVELGRRANGRPRAVRVLRDVLRSAAGLDAVSALRVESIGYSLLLAGPEYARWLRSRPAVGAARDHADPLLMRRAGPVLDLELNRPHTRNAYSAAMRDALAEAFCLAAADTSITEIQLRGKGPSFCSGGDLREFGQNDDPVVAHAVRVDRGAQVHIASRRTLMVARVHGACVGAGVELSAFADRVVADKDTHFSLPELTMGLIPGAGGTVSVPARIGRSRTILWLLAGAAISAPTALRWGLVDSVE